LTYFASVNSYDANAPLPAVGTRWVWEIDQPAARALIEVKAVRWNGEEWWVETEALMPDSYPSSGGRAYNDVGRFWEAVTVVGEVIVLRCPDLAVEGQESYL